MSDIKYCEVDMSNPEGDVYSMCIKATHIPTKEEVKQFLAEDMRNFGCTDIDLIVETTLEEAKNFYDMTDEQHFPVLS